MHFFDVIFAARLLDDGICGRSRNSPGPRSRNSSGWPVGSFYLVFVVDWGTTRPGRLLGR